MYTTHVVADMHICWCCYGIFILASVECPAFLSILKSDARAKILCLVFDRISFEATLA